MKKLKTIIFGIFWGLGLGSLLGGEIVCQKTGKEGECLTSLAGWLEGKGATGDWFGLRTALDRDYGFSVRGNFAGAFFGVLSSEDGAGGFWGQAIDFGAEQNLGKLLRVPVLENVKIFGQFRWRDPRQDADANTFIHATGLFTSGTWAGGTQFRVLSFGVQWTSGDWLPVKDMVTITGGWLRPQAEFLAQPLSLYLLNNSTVSAKGLGGNIPFASSVSTWGGSLCVKPTEYSYIKGALFMSFPGIGDSSNHGLAYRGYAPDPSRNDYWFMGEAGITPKICGQPGKYAFGAYYYGEKHETILDNHTRRGRYGFYWQADQKIYTPAGTVPERGLSIFTLFTAAPKEDNTFPFYFHAGLAYQGIVSARPRDMAICAFSYGSYSEDLRKMNHRNHIATPTYTGVIEAAYRVQLTPWSFIQPFAQYVIRPNGTSEVRNASILGIYTGITF